MEISYAYLLVIISTCYVYVTGAMPCNTSYTADKVNIGSEEIQIKSPIISGRVVGKAYYCVYELRAPEGSYVSAKVVEVVTGEGNFNFTENR